MISVFGTMLDGEKVERVEIGNGDLTASIITYGATIQDLRLKCHQPSLVLGFADFAPYLSHRHFGAMVGRVANRIAKGQFALSGKTYQVDCNFLGRHMLHGGSSGVSLRNWQITGHDDHSVTMEIVDRESETRFPGDCTITCTYAITGPATLKIDVAAVTTAPTPVNVAHHSYFNLEGDGDILDHQLQVHADHYLPVDEELIPTGKIRSVTGTEFDFRVPRPVGSGGVAIYDHNFCLADKQRQVSEIARLSAPRSGIVMILSSTEPGLQFYAGANVNAKHPGLNNQQYRAYSGLALEPQLWPDAVNQPGFPDTLLQPGDTYRQTSLFAFSKEPAPEFSPRTSAIKTG
jgi:aldose 1-epimerase